MDELTTTDLKERLAQIVIEVVGKHKEAFGEAHIATKEVMWRSGVEVLKDYPELEDGRGGRGSSTFNAVATATDKSNHAIKRWVDLVKTIGKTEEDFECWAETAKQKAIASWQQGLLAAGKTNEPPIIPPGKYKVIYIDPPWKYENSGFEMSAEKHYPVLSIEQLCSMGENIKDISADNCILFMWVTNPFLEESLEVPKAWGFEYKTNIVWVKKNHTAGFYLFGKHELLLICTKGSILPEDAKLKSVVKADAIEAENTIHSKKPPIFYELIEKSYPINNKQSWHLEIFARGEERKGWKFVGNEL